MSKHPITPSKAITVRAVKRGYYQYFRNVGDVFTVKSESDVGKWMERVADEGGKLPHPAEHAHEKKLEVDKKQDARTAGEFVGAQRVI